MNNPRIAIIVDGPNYFHMIKHLGCNFNFWTLIDNIESHSKIITSWHDDKFVLGQNPRITQQKYYYDALPLEKEANSFLKALKSIGFELIAVKLKPYEHNENYQNYNGNGNSKKYKSRTEFPIYIDLIRLLDENAFDILILFSGDSDFEFLLEECKKAGKRVIIFSTFSNLAKELKNVAEVILLENLLNTELFIGRK